MSINEFFKKNNLNFQTQKEINNQFSLWPILIEKIEKQYKKQIDKFKKILDNDYKFIISGAGTSEFVGNIAKSLFNIKNIDSIATTDLITNFSNYIKKDEKIVLVSIARSGNSPESLATYNLCNSFKNIIHIIITCNKDGQLYQNGLKNDKTITFLLPKLSNDLGFAMTSSFTCLLITLIYILEILLFNNLSFLSINKLELLSNWAKNFVENDNNWLLELNYKKLKRIVVLGSNENKFFAQEGSLKILELSGGKNITTFNSYLGFRHGPKAIINDKTMVICLRSSNKLVRKYEDDLINELILEEKASILILDTITNNFDNKKNNIYSLKIELDNELNNPLFNGLVYIFLLQYFALLNSISLGLNPDNPFPNQMVNRVVKGVKIYYE